jgi:hypothetical protein
VQEITVHLNFLGAIGKLDFLKSEAETKEWALLAKLVKKAQTVFGTVRLLTSVNPVPGSNGSNGGMGGLGLNLGGKLNILNYSQVYLAGSNGGSGGAGGVGGHGGNGQFNMKYEDDGVQGGKGGNGGNGGNSRRPLYLGNPTAQSVTMSKNSYIGLKVGSGGAGGAGGAGGRGGNGGDDDKNGLRDGGGYYGLGGSGGNGGKGGDNGFFYLLNRTDGLPAEDVYPELFPTLKGLNPENYNGVSGKGGAIGNNGTPGTGYNKSGGF